MNFLQVSGLTKYYKESLVLDRISFHRPSFRRLAISGETGSGKTTLLKAIGGLVQPDGGEVLFRGEKILGPEEKLLPGHPHIAYLSQHFELRNNYKLSDFMEMASKVGEREAQQIYELCQIDHLLKRKTDQLSGGERQRTALARLLTTSPRLLLLDEPFSNLDGIHKQVLKTVLNDIVEKGKISCIMVSHDPVDVLPWAEEVLVLKDGRIHQQGTPEEIYRQPIDEYAGGLFGDYNLIPAIKGKVIFGLNELADEKKIFIRPENIRLRKNDENAQQGEVTGIYYFGSSYEVEVYFDEVKLLVTTMTTNLQKGDKVTASVSLQDIRCF